MCDSCLSTYENTTFSLLTSRGEQHTSDNKATEDAKHAQTAGEGTFIREED